MHQAKLAFKSQAYLGEGSIWDWEQKRLLWLDIANGELFAFHPQTGENTLLFKSEQTVGTVVQRENGGFAVVLTQGFYFVDEETGTARMICEPEAGKPEVRFNDGKCDPAGRFWAGSYGAGGTGSLFRLGTDYRCDKMLDGITVSNGIAWSADSKTMYYTDTHTGVIWAFDYDIDTGDIRNRRTAVEIPAGEGGPDGFTLDEEGMLWVAQWGGWQVGRYDPTTGKKLDSVSVPVEEVSSCAFGGENLDELYITTARENQPEEKLLEQPLAGSLFVARVGVRGVRANKFRG